jgi:predicted Zn finger-like uncharacterized protein
MLTTCPECRTVFRVGQDQLDNKRGLVRCGTCAAVFNAYDTLLPELAAPPVEETGGEAVGGSAPEPPAPPDLEVISDDVLNMPPALEVESPFQASALNLPAQESTPEGSSGEPTVPPVEAEPAWITPGEAPAAAEAPASPEPELAERVMAPPPRPDDILLTPLTTVALPSAAPGGGGWLPSLAWGLVALLLGAILALQMAYFLRAELASALPELRPAIQRACARLGCTLPLARDLTSLRIESSSLESDPEDKSRASLILSLSNRARQPVAWPHLILVLSDARDLPVAQRPFAPSEYLPAQAAGRPGMDPEQEQEVRLELELKGLSAYGYKLEMAYP